MSEESALSAILEEILQAHQSSPDDSSYESAKAQLHVERRSPGRSKYSRLVKVLVYEKLVLVLALVLLPLGPHFSGRREFSINWLGRSIDTVMGLYLRFVVSQAGIMKKLASDDDFPDYETVNNTLERACDDGPGSAEAREQIGLWKKQIANSQDTSDLTVFNRVFRKIDVHANEAFAQLPCDVVGEKTDAYMCALDDYCHNVVTSLRAEWLKGSNDPTELSDVMRRYDRIIARIAIWLSPQDDARDAPIPLLSAWLLDYAWSSLDGVKEGVIEICRWFEPLLDYYPSLHAHSHVMDDKSEVMIYNVINSVRIIAPDADVQLSRFLWDNRNTSLLYLHNTMSSISERERQQDRPRDREQINDAFDKLPAHEKERNAWKRDLRHNEVTGAYAITPKRDLEPCVKAILLELHKAGTYRTAILADSFAAGLRKQLQDLLVHMTNPIYAELLGDRMESQVWQWWDGIEIEIPEDITPVTSANGDENFRLELRRTQLRDKLEQQDQDTIKEIVKYITQMSCAKSTPVKDSPLSSEVAEALNALINALELSSTRLRNRIIADDPNLPFDGKDVVRLRIPKVEGSVDAHTIKGPRLPALLRNDLEDPLPSTKTS
ncbi:hypothetical protein DFH29DRAFT_928138, partial [Suillus ampliporus]